MTSVHVLSVSGLSYRSYLLVGSLVWLQNMEASSDRSYRVRAAAATVQTHAAAPVSAVPVGLVLVLIVRGGPYPLPLKGDPLSRRDQTPRRSLVGSGLFA